jgi:UvrD-like helicase C-terminal domain
VDHDPPTPSRIATGPPIGSPSHAPNDLGAVRDAVASSGAQLISAAQSGDAPAALGALTQHRLLCAHREGPYGQRNWADRAVEWTIARVKQALEPSEFYPGQPLLITANDYQTGVYNGDIGVVVAAGDGVMAAIERGQIPLLIHPNVLSSVQTAYAMTIHRSQGSQYRGVSVILPEPDSPLLSRQLLYTAITRARDQVRILATEDAVAAAVTPQVRRASGLRLQLREVSGEVPELGTRDRDPVVDEAIVVERATADRRDARYQSIDEFSDAVERAIGKPGTKRESAEGTARRLLERIRLPKSTDDDLRELLKWALALDENSVDDMKALTGVIPRLSNKVINRLWKFNRDGFARVYARYVGYVESPNSGFPFEDCDALADFGLRAVARTKNQRILRATLTSLTAMGYRHQRWHVREVVTTILQSIRKPEDAVAPVEALRATDIYAVRWALEDFSFPSLDPRLRDGVMALLDDSGTG